MGLHKSPRAAPGAWAQDSSRSLGGESCFFGCLIALYSLEGFVKGLSGFSLGVMRDLQGEGTGSPCTGATRRFNDGAYKFKLARVLVMYGVSQRFLPGL